MKSIWITLWLGVGGVVGGASTNHWAFEGPVRPVLPRISEPTSTIRNPIDLFIAAEHEKRGLKAVPEAGKEILLRRVWLDLTGLPPTREELRKFLSDTAPDAYERVVDRLLNSPQHAERWARHWMDIWRYSDWYGRRHVPDVWNSAPQVWRWRDWIIRSLNEDKGYDQMLVEMLAADEVSPEDDSARVATGYLVRNWYALNSNQWMRDVVEHTGKAFLGLTLNCAHCHDHKYDPIQQTDYFRFRAFFEPLQVRQDRVEGEPDPGPFQKYEYSANRRVVTNGMVSVFDEKLDAKTFLYLNGDERSFPPGKPAVDPGVPEFLGREVRVQPVELPQAAAYPGLKGFVREAEVLKHREELSAARASWEGAKKVLEESAARYRSAESLAARTQALGEMLAGEVALKNQSKKVELAEAEWEALEARLAADEVIYGLRSASENGSGGKGGGGVELARERAVRAERSAAVRKAEAKLAAVEGTLVLARAEQQIGSARGTKGTEKTNEIAKVQERLAAVEKELQSLKEAQATNKGSYTPLTPVYPAQSSGRRKALAEWIASRSNPLTARVAVNHIWNRHFHAPLVESVFDFGRNGAKPSHPELLDWLAVELMENGWSMKHLHRLMVTSGAYRRASSGRAVLSEAGTELKARQGETGGGANEEIDSGNRYLWRMNRGQMEAEVIRDSILHVAGELDLTPARNPLPNSEAEMSRRRSVYFECFPEPKGQSEFAEMFDAASPMECYRRSQTVMPQQALALVNSRLSHERSKSAAERVVRSAALGTADRLEEFVEAIFEQVLSRQPTRAEESYCLEFLEQQRLAQGLAAAQASLAHVLFNHNDFITIR